MAQRALELRIWRPDVGAPFIYTDVHVLDSGDVETNDRFKPGSFEQTNVAVAVATGTFCGFTDPVDFPADAFSWRAALYFDGAEVFNGVVPDDSVTFYDRTGEWHVTLLDNATTELKARLAQVRLVGGLTGAAYTALVHRTMRAVALYKFENTNLVVGEQLDQLVGLRAYRASSVLEAVRLAVGLVTGQPLLGAFPSAPPFPFPSSTDANAVWASPDTDRHVCSVGGWSGGVVQSYVSGRRVVTFPEEGYSSSSLTLPDWTGQKFVEEWAALNGWTLRARYEPAPSMSLRLDVLTDLVVEPVSPADVGALPSGGGNALQRQAAFRPGLALQLGDAADASPDVDVLNGPVNAWGGTNTTAWDVPYAPPAALPPWALVGVGTWTFEGANVRADTKQSSAFTLGRACVLQSRPSGPPVTLHGQTMQYLSGPLFVDFSAPEDALLVVPFWYPEGFNDALHYVAVTPAAGRPPFFNPVWASAFLAGHELSRARLLTLETKRQTADPDLGTVGQFSGGVTIRGRSWAILSRRANFDQNHVALTLGRPTGELDRTPGWPGDLAGSRVGAVLDLVGEYGNATSEYGLFRLTWRAPFPSSGGWRAFEVQRYHNQAGIFQLFITQCYATQCYDFTEDESWGFVPNTDLRSMRYRVRALAAPGIAGGNGPWTETLITFDPDA